MFQESDYSKQDMHFLAEDAFVQQKGQFLDLIRTTKTREAAASVVETAGGPSAPRTTLPRIQFPQFSGKYEDWPAFRDLFLSIIGKDASTTQVEKLHYLKTCLKGEADSLIRNLTTTAENYGRAWKMLSEYYENKRLLVRAYLSNFVSLSKMKTESTTELRKIFHCIKATVNSLAGINRPINQSEDLFVYLAVELLDPRSRRHWETAISDTAEPPSFATLEQFLDRRLHTLEAMTPLKVDAATSKPGNGSTKATRAHLAKKQDSKPEIKRSQCPLCEKDHFVMLCDEYKKKTAAERKLYVEERGLCLNCLGRHRVSECASKKDCTACGGRHHTSIHDACRSIAAVKAVHVTKESVVKPVSVILATARVRIADRHGNWHAARALVDQGSESSLLSERLAQKLRLPRSPVSVTVFGVGGQKTCVAKGRVKFSLSSRDMKSLSVAALVLPRLIVYSGGAVTAKKSWPHLTGLNLADPEYDLADPIDILLGAEVYASILDQGLRKGERCEPIAQNTSLGWILSGAIEEITGDHAAHYHQCKVDLDLTGLVQRLWEQEEVPNKICSKEDEECENHYVRTHSRDRDGRYVVRLPRVDPLPEFSATRRAVARMLRIMEEKFARDSSFRELYVSFMSQYAELEHMTPVGSVANSTPTPVCFLPHHGVMREASSSTKLRVVFNGLAAVAGAGSLNQHLKAGPNLLPPLADILLRWRLHRYVLIADIEKMYRQIKIHPKDRDLQRVLWRYNSEEPVQEYQLTTVTYGLACAPFLAIRTLRQLADDEEPKFPLGATILRRDFYMDDLLTGSRTLDEAREIQLQIMAICRAGGFPLKKWSSNDASLLESLPAADRMLQEPRWWQSGESHLTLGLRWLPHEDAFAFSISTFQLEVISKRTVLSLTARLFDPLGWLAPAIVRAKIMFQSTWLLSIEWDTPLPIESANHWRDFQAELPLLGGLRVPRWLTIETVNHSLQIHGFADASERAYAAVVYTRIENPEGEVDVRLVTAKTKVAPLKPITLPRLELSAATLLVRLVAHVQRVLEAFDAPIHLWSDSTVALAWIRGHPAFWKTYVANRVSEIQTTLPTAVWHHVAGTENPADCASRGLSTGALLKHDLWWAGLCSPSKSWTSDAEIHELNAIPEQRVRNHAATAKEVKKEPELLIRHSVLHRLLRVTAWWRRWLRVIRRADASSSQSKIGESPFLTVSELNEAYWIRVVQALHFPKELAALKQG